MTAETRVPADRDRRIAEAIERAADEWFEAGRSKEELFSSLRAALRAAVAGPEEVPEGPPHGDRVTVCAKCLRVSCWHGEWMCAEARSANTTSAPVDELIRMKREHPERIMAAAREENGA